MANVSEAYGTMTITAKDEETVVFIREAIFKTTSKWYYGTHLSETDKAEGNDDGTCSQCCYFYGDGRWEYHTNLEFMMRSLTDTMKASLARLEGTDFTLLFEYVDVERGCQHLARETARFTHKANTPLVESKLEVLEQQYYDWTPENLRAVADYDDDAIESADW